MTEPEIKPPPPRAARFIRVFRFLTRAILVAGALLAAYWALFASDRYVSEANVIIRGTNSIAMPTFDLSALAAGIGGVGRSDQLLLREYLLSVDMLKKLDARLDLRAHYSDARRDIASRLWFQDASMEWFHRHYLARTSVTYDDYAGVLRIAVQAYDAATAQAIAAMLVEEGERTMNQLGHELAETQVNFLIGEVGAAQQRLQAASQELLDFQNSKGMLSPKLTAEGIHAIIANLEAERARLQTQLAALPKSLDPQQANILILKQSLAAVDRQIAQENAKLATAAGKTLNATMEQFHRLQMAVEFTQDVYKSSLTALERGRIDATRLLDKVSVLQAPTLAEYPMQPRRFYNVFVSVLGALALAGLLKLLEGIVLDHVD